MFNDKERLIIENLSDRFSYRSKSYRAIQKMIDDMITGKVYQQGFKMETESRERFLKDIEPFVNKKLVDIEQDENTIIVKLGINSLNKDLIKIKVPDSLEIYILGLFEKAELEPIDYLDRAFKDVLPYFKREKYGKGESYYIYIKSNDYEGRVLLDQYLTHLINSIDGELEERSDIDSDMRKLIRKSMNDAEKLLLKLKEKIPMTFEQENKFYGLFVSKYESKAEAEAEAEATEEDLRIVPESSIQRLRDSVSKIKTVNPSSEKYQELVKFIEEQKPFAQLQIYGADIRFISTIAKHRLESKRRSIFDYIHRLYPNNKVPISVMKNGYYTIIKNEFTYKDSEPSYDRFLDRMYDYLIFESVLTKRLGRKLEYYLGYRLYKIATPLGLSTVEQNKDIKPLKELMKNKVINEMINGIKILFEENFDMSRTDHYKWNIDFGTLGRSKDDAIAVNSYKDEQIVVQIWFDKIIISHNDTYNQTFKTIIEYDLHDLRLIVNERFFAKYLIDKTPQNIVDKLRGRGK